MILMLKRELESKEALLKEREKKLATIEVILSII